jgi:hypothetical protein
VSDFPRPSEFRTTQLTLTRDADGRANQLFIPVQTFPLGMVPGALWQVDPASGDAATIPGTEDPDALYTDAEARGDCQALSCTVIYSRCQHNAGIFGNMPSLELFGIAGIIPLLGTYYDGFEATRCAISIARGATADEVFVGTANGYDDGRIDVVSGDPVEQQVVATLPRGPFDYAPYPVGLARVVQPTPLTIPEAGAGAAALGAGIALAALGARRQRAA